MIFIYQSMDNGGGLIISVSDRSWHDDQEECMILSCFAVHYAPALEPKVVLHHLLCHDTRLYKLDGSCLAKGSEHKGRHRIHSIDLGCVGFRSHAPLVVVYVDKGILQWDGEG